MQPAIPEVASLPLQLIVTGFRYQPFASEERAGAALPTVGAVASILIVFVVAPTVPLAFDAEHERVVPEREGLDLGVAEGAREPDLRFAAQDHLENLLRVPRPDGDEDLGIHRLEALEHIGQEVGAEQ